MLKIITSDDPALRELFPRFFGRYRSEKITPEIKIKVAEIIAAVEKEGDEALLRFTGEFDQVNLSADQLPVEKEEIKAAYQEVSSSFLTALASAKENITAFHQKQLANSWFETNALGVFLGQLVRPLNRVGIYVPGGTAAYPSSVLMSVLPAKVAGVKEIALVTPPQENGKVNPHVLVAAALAGVEEIYRVGGAQAVAALAYGTETIKPVDKIVGPGNLYVTLAKQLVYGQVDIDLLAGPSEVLIIADELAKAPYIAADLLAQAAHDSQAVAILLTPDSRLAANVVKEVERQINTLPRKEIISRALMENGAIVITKDLKEAFALANCFAPEHLELMIGALNLTPLSWLEYVVNAGAVFLGSYSPEAAGDYLAGPSHVLPTGGTARFYSSLNVATFLKKSSVIAYPQEALIQEAPKIIRLALTEGLTAHAQAVKIRMEQNDDVF
ncbi:histidinol dehydrogenase [Peptococcaceae bacterium SCADC1_2_3]|nr:histidinol dehydrogenase [Peptococcaceae bacterium SCADC1_2_3]